MDENENKPPDVTTHYRNMIEDAQRLLTTPEVKANSDLSNYISKAKMDYIVLLENS